MKLVYCFLLVPLLFFGSYLLGGPSWPGCSNADAARNIARLSDCADEFVELSDMKLADVNFVNLWSGAKRAHFLVSSVQGLAKDRQKFYSQILRKVLEELDVLFENSHRKADLNKMPQEIKESSLLTKPLKIPWQEKIRICVNNIYVGWQRAKIVWTSAPFEDANKEYVRKVRLLSLLQQELVSIRDEIESLDDQSGERAKALRGRNEKIVRIYKVLSPLTPEQMGKLKKFKQGDDFYEKLQEGLEENGFLLVENDQIRKKDNKNFISNPMDREG
ncbi:MAG: hypothetical protein M1549_00410 [Candidatus Dependentiae bacterium]|nr:hypothetical protein [Candidatus Dependentiae bacterium]